MPTRSVSPISATASWAASRSRATGPCEAQLDKEQRQEVQRRLAAFGHYVGETDGKFGSKTREAVRAFQLQRGLVADGYANPVILRELRAVR